MEDITTTNISQPVITFDMLISYLKHGEYVKLPPNSSENLTNVSTIEFPDPYNVEPDLSAGVCHLCSQDAALTSGVVGVHPVLHVPHSGRGPRFYHEFYRVLALLEKQKGWKQNSWDNNCTANVLAVDRIPSPAHKPHPD